jgi:hypothetical protein
MNDLELKQPIIKYIRGYYRQNGETPPLRKIIKRFEREKLNFSRFYEIFPGRMSEACGLAGVPIPTERIRRTDRATQASKMTEPTPHVQVCPSRPMLSDEQTKRLLGISHLEGGKEPLIIIDELLDRDAKLRNTYKLSFKDTKMIADFLNLAIGKGWQVPWLLSVETYLWNSGFMDLDQQALKWLADLLKQVKHSGLKVEDLMRTFRKTENEWEEDIKKAYDTGFENGMKTFESAYVKSVLGVVRDRNTLTWLYKIGNLTKLQALADRNGVKD